MDTDDDSFVSSKDFKDWLRPPSNRDDKIFRAEYLRSIIDLKYDGDVEKLFNEFRSRGTDRIYSADFITHMRVVDPSFPMAAMKDLAAELTLKDKTITLGSILDFIGKSKINDAATTFSTLLEEPESFNIVNQGYSLKENEDENCLDQGSEEGNHSQTSFC